MDQPTPSEEKKSFLQNDRKLVCLMLIVYGVCILGFIGATFWGLDRRSKQISANATSTASVLATQHANSTATVVAHREAQKQYELIDLFSTNKNRWRSGPENNDYWSGNIEIKSGFYLWNIKTTKYTFVSWADFTPRGYIYDFDVYVDTRVEEAEPGDVCSGLLFRISPDGWDEGGYYFALCNDSRIKVSYHTEKDGWKNIVSLPYHERSNDWDRLEISARGSHFTFFMNGDKVYEMEDDRQKVGDLALAVELNETVSARVLFDNFGLQPR